MKARVMDFESFSYCCPYFTSDTEVNNGYGCTHPEQDETDPDENGAEHGKCYSFSCPLGIEPDEEDFENPDVDWDGITREDCISSLDGRFCGDDYIMVSVGPDATEDEKQALYNCERYQNRYNPEWTGGNAQ
jgi:hypothetical protein